MKPAAGLLSASVIVTVLAIPGICLAAPACPSRAAATSELHRADRLTSALDAATTLYGLATRLSTCDPNAPIVGDAFFAAAMATQRSNDPDGAILADATTVAVHDKRYDRVAELGWRWARADPLNPDVQILANALDDAFAKQFAANPKAWGGGLPVQTIEQSASLSPFLCKTLVDAVLAPTAPAQLSPLGLPAFRCAIRFRGRDQSIALGKKLATAADLKADAAGVQRFEVLAALAIAVQDEGLEQAVVRSGTALQGALAANRNLANRLTLALVGVHAEYGQIERASLLADLCTESLGEEDLEACRGARGIVSLKRRDAPGMANLRRVMGSPAGEKNPSFAWPALRYAQAEIENGGRAEVRRDRDAFGAIGPAQVLRDCVSARDTSGATAFASSAAVLSGFVSERDNQTFLTCAHAALPLLNGGSAPPVAAAIATALADLDLKRTAELRIGAARAVLSQSPATQADFVGQIVHWDLDPLISAPAGIVSDDARLRATQLLWRVATDRGDADEAARLKLALAASGHEPPTADAPKPPSQTPLSTEALALLEWQAKIDEILFRFELGSAAEFAALDADRVSTRQTKVDASIKALALLQRYRANSSPIAHELGNDDTTCVVGLLDQMTAILGVIDKPENDAINAMSPSRAQMKQFGEQAFDVSLSDRKASAATPVVVRQGRTRIEAILDLAFDVQAWAALGNSKAAIAAYRRYLALRPAVERSGPACPFGVHIPAAQAARDALLFALADEAPRLTQAELWPLVAQALAPDDMRLEFYPAGATLEERRRRMETLREQTAVELAAKALDVEGVRQHSSRVRALEDATPLGIQGRGRLTPFLPALQQAQGKLGQHEAMVSVRTALIGSQMAHMTVVITADRLQLIKATGAVDEQGLVRAVDVSGVRAASRLRPFDTAAAHRLYELTLGRAQLAGVTRLLVLDERLRLPLGLLVVTPAPTSSAGGAIYRDAHWLIDDYEIAYLDKQADLSTLARAPFDGTRRRSIVFAAPSYGQRAAQAVTARSAREPPSGNGALLAPACGLDPLVDLESRLGRSSPDFQIYAGPRATEREVHRLNSSGALKSAEVIVFYAHGEAVAGGAMGPVAAIALSPTPGCGDAAAGIEEDGHLTADEVSTLDLGAAWILLAGCRTARGEIRVMRNLPEAFFAAGAQVVIGSVGEVPADATAEFARTIASQSGNGDAVTTATEAVRKVRRASQVRSAADGFDLNGQWDHPAFWGAWIVALR